MIGTGEATGADAMRMSYRCAGMSLSLWVQLLGPVKSGWAELLTLPAQHAVPRDGAQVALQRCPILRTGAWHDTTACRWVTFRSIGRSK